ncbi:MAG: hypothetical protein LBH01_06840 [Verrucomicrobiales bacterium]|jgi:hypothetical protein|nr:hypothetical protein [Verrucomicrobiales bacterium]
MKTKVFSAIIALAGTFLLFFTSTAPAATYVRVGVGVGYGGGCGYYPYRPWGYHPYGPAYFGPTIVYTTPLYTASTVYVPASTTTTTTQTTTTSTPASTQPQAQVTPANNNITSAPPYGIPESDTQVKSPFSNFMINDTGMKSGTVVYDAYTGQPFRIP